MHYRPFRFEDYPNVHKALEGFPVDFTTQRTTKNMRYYEGEAAVDLTENFVTVEHVFDIREDRLDPKDYAPSQLKALRYLLEQINEADRIDAGIAYTTAKTLFEVNKTFRYFHQMYGGKRYVALCRDLIDKNMGSSLFPYMYEDLVVGIFVNYNKNASRDILGLFSGIVELLEETELTTEALKRIYSGIYLKCGSNHYQDFLEICLASKKLCASMREYILDGYIPSRFDGKYSYPQVGVPMLLSFGKEDICALLEGLPAGMKSMVWEILASFGDQIDPDYAKAYLRNPNRDMSLLAEAPFFNSLPAETKKEIARGRIFSPNAKKTEIVSYYASVQDDPKAREMVLAACEDFGQSELAKALTGKDFVLTGFSVLEIEALLPFANFETPTMVSRLTAYLKRYGISYVHSDALERLFMSLHDEGYRDLIRFGLSKNCVLDRARRLCLADRFGLIGELGYKEWKYHA